MASPDKAVLFLLHTTAVLGGGPYSAAVAPLFLSEAAHVEELHTLRISPKSGLFVKLAVATR